VLSEGTQLKHGTFVIIRELGKGGFGEVYLGRQPRMQRDVAIKVLLPRVADNPDVVARFQREALAAATLSHPNVLPVYDFDFDEDSQVWFLAMQFVRGGETLKDRMIGPMDVVLTSRIVFQLAGVLDDGHAHDIVHRDVKPANVLMDGDRPLLTDFGIAHLGSMSGLTATGMAIGTPTYMSPEQAMGKPVGPKSDQYALAVMAYEMLAGRPPFTGDPLSLINQQVNSPPPPLGSYNPGVPAAGRAAIVLALSKNPDDRYMTCGEFATALLAAVGDTQAMGSSSATAPAFTGQPMRAGDGSSMGTQVPLPSAPDSVSPASAPNWAASASPPTLPSQAAGASLASGASAGSAPSGAPVNSGVSRGATVSSGGLGAVAEPAAGVSRATMEETIRHDVSDPNLSASANLSALRSSIGTLDPREAVVTTREAKRRGGMVTYIAAFVGGTVVLVVAALYLFGVNERGGSEPATPVVGGSITSVPATAATVPPQPGTGAVTVRSIPDGAAIAVNGEPAGRAPRLLSLRPGEHTISLSLPSYRDFTRRVTVTEGEQISLPADLQPIPSFELLDVTETRMGKEPSMTAGNILRLGTFADTFLVSDDLQAVVYLRSKAAGVRDFAFNTIYRWERQGQPPAELTGRFEQSKNDEQLYLHTCAPAVALDPRGSGEPLKLEVLVDNELMATFNFRIQGGNSANAARNPCDTSSLPRTSA
jgi:serine/threonine-protein kinase